MPNFGKPLNKFKGHYPINKARAYNAEVKDLFKSIAIHEFMIGITIFSL